MANETFKVTNENREVVLRLAIAIANLKDVDATIPVRREELEQQHTKQLEGFEQSAASARKKKLDVVRAVEKDLIGDLAQGVFVTLADDGTEYSVNKPGQQLGPVPGKKARVAKPADRKKANKKRLAPVK